ncbi:hypothetical protein ACFL0O_06110 [Thermodesulfobacteriota bacterium]
MDEEKNDMREDIDWENRTLCSDESCIGTLGPDGQCNVCDKAYEGELPADDHDDSVESAYVDEEGFETEAFDEEDDSTPDIDWESRTLCSDESCIGVIGSDGRCKECGNVFENG